MSDPAAPPDFSTRVAIRHTIFAQMCGAILTQILVQGGLASLLVLSAGGNDFHVGLVFTIGSLALVCRLAVSPRIDVMSPRRFMVRGMMIAGCIACTLFLSRPVQVFFGDVVGLWYIIAMLSLFQLANFVAGASWFSLLNFIIPPRLRGRYFGYMRRAWGVTVFVIMLIAGWLLGDEPTLTRFYPIFLIAIVFYFGRIYFLSLLPDPPPGRSGKPESVLQSLSRPLADQTYRIFLIFLTVRAFVTAMVIPFAVPFMKSDLGIPDGRVVYATSAMLVGAMLTLPYWGRVADAIGNRFVLFIGLMLKAAAVAILASAPVYAVHPYASFGMCMGAFFLIGIGQSSFGIGQTVRQFHLSPRKYHAPYSNIVHASRGLAGAAAAFLAGVVYNAMPQTLHLAGLELLSKRPAFYGAAAIYLLMILALRLLIPIREPHAARIARMIVYNLPSPIAGPMLALARVTRNARPQDDDR